MDLQKDKYIIAEIIPTRSDPKDGFIAQISALKLDGIKFREFFQWLSASISRVSASQVGDKVDLPNAGGWASI